MVISSPPSNVATIQEQDATATTTKNTSTPAPVTFGSPLTPLDEVELSTPHEPQCRRSLLKDNDAFWDALEVFDDCMYDSDGNMPPEVTEVDLFHFEDAISTEVPSTAEPLVQQENIALINDDELKRMKVDVLKAELRKRGLSTSGKKAELLERLRKAMVDKIPHWDYAIIIYFAYC